MIGALVIKQFQIGLKAKMIKKNLNYAPVATFEIHDINKEIHGIAAPENSTLPCILKLRAQDIDFEIIPATRFSKLASRKGIKLGWCGFQIKRLQEAFIVSDTVKITCGITDRVLFKIPFSNDYFYDYKSNLKKDTVEFLISSIGDFDSTENIENILPFAVNYYSVFGVESFIKATYQTFLGRYPELSASKTIHDFGNIELSVLKYLEEVTKSTEFLTRSKKLPGPFNKNFFYSKEILR